MKEGISSDMNEQRTKQNTKESIPSIITKLQVAIADR
jgi:hypothetical protein